MAQISIIAGNRAKGGELSILLETRTWTLSEKTSSKIDKELIAVRVLKQGSKAANQKRSIGNHQNARFCTKEKHGLTG